MAAVIAASAAGIQLLLFMRPEFTPFPPRLDTLADCEFTESPMKNLDPVAAYAFLQANPEALLVDCRTEVEYMCVGHPIGAEHIAWQEAPDWQVDPHFADKVRAPPRR
jgi:hypothetical protein